MLSMTGFGVGHAALGQGRVVVEARSVNHRYLDLKVRAPQELNASIAAIESRARSLGRGRVDVTVRLEGVSAVAVTLDLDRARQAMASLGELRDEIAPGEPLPLALLAAVPELFKQRPAVLGDVQETAVTTAAERAFEALTTMRRREGDALRTDLLDRLRQTSAMIEEVAELSPPAVAAQSIRLRDRIAKLAEAAAISIDGGRVEQEIALLADRADVSEELTRLRSHFGQMKALLSSSGEAIGRKMDFLLQEMTRETNTIGAKCNDVTISHRIVDVKAELERMREQVQNVL